MEEKTEEKQEKTLTKNISFHEKVCVKTIPSITKSSSETSETSEESSESIEIPPPKKNKPKENLKRTPTQLLMGTVGKIIGLLFGSLFVSLKKDMRKSSGKRWKTGLFGCLIDSSTLITAGVSNCPLKFVCSAGQCSRPLRTALGSAVQCSAVIEQSNFRENLGSFGQFFYCFSTDFFLFFAAMEKFS